MDYSDVRLAIHNQGKRQAKNVSVQILERLSPTSAAPISGNRFLRWTGLGTHMTTIPRDGRATVDFLYFVPEPSEHSTWSISEDKLDPGVARLCLIKKDVPLEFFQPGSLGDCEQRSFAEAEFLLCIVSEDEPVAYHHARVRYAGGAPFPHVPLEDPRSISERVGVELTAVELRRSLPEVTAHLPWSRDVT